MSEFSPDAAYQEIAAQIIREVLATLAERRPVRGSTYRLQFHAKFTFRDAAAIVPYLHDLGITHVYASPYLKAQPGSLHGYDVCKHDELNPELGAAEDYAALVEALRQRGMAHILDVVPNHMAASSENAWWMDVLESGPYSPYAHYFDIDWHPAQDALANKVLLPILGQQFGDALEAGELQLEHHEGGFFLRYFDHRLPIGPKTAIPLLTHRLDELRLALGETTESFVEYQSILTALDHLPSQTSPSPELVAERQREKEVIKRRLKRLEGDEPLVAEFIARNLQEFNGRSGEPSSFDRLDELLGRQSYRLSHWKAASDEVNYRRFFDINGLAALCMERSDVFADTHRLVLDLLARGDIDGLRIDHIDGLYDPLQYLWRLQWAYLDRLGQRVFERLLPANSEATTAVLANQANCATFSTEEAPVASAATPSPVAWTDLQGLVVPQLCQELGLADPEADTGAHTPRPVTALPLYVVVEKILGPDEPLPSNWPVAGTTGYDFLHQLNGLYIEPAGVRDVTQAYFRFTGERLDFAETVYRSKRLILRVAMSSELQMLAQRLDRISEQQRRSRDFTLNNLRYALREILSYFPVYRTYPGPAGVSDRDRRFVQLALAQAKRRNPVIDSALFEFVRGILLLEHSEGLSESARQERELFTGKFQQVTSPVMAKGMEDTTFYIYCPLVSLNDVGCHPNEPIVSREQFHRDNTERLNQWPLSMLCTTSHDTKRTEDVRARINVLAEVPHLWRKAVNSWSRSNRRFHREVDGLPAPSRNDEYLFYQSLVGIWPSQPPDAAQLAELIGRLQQYMEKATREEKERTSWISPNAAYDEAVRQFVSATLEPRRDNKFLADFQAFHESVLDAGLYNALSQVVLKLASPGVPDVYQGQEAWDFSLVDPDNRRPVDYALRQRLLAEFQAKVASGEGSQLELARRLARTPRDPRLKLFGTWRLLQLRRAQTELFTSGDYIPLEVTGPAAQHACAFAWRSKRARGGGAIVVAPRFCMSLLVPAKERAEPTLWQSDAWRDTHLALGPAGGAWRDIFTGRTFDLYESAPLGELLDDFPAAVLVSVE